MKEKLFSNGFGLPLVKSAINNNNKINKTNKQTKIVKDIYDLPRNTRAQTYISKAAICKIHQYTHIDTPPHTQFTRGMTKWSGTTRQVNEDSRGD